MTLTKSFVRLSVLLGESLLAAAGSAAGPDRPNILLVLVDDLRFDDLGAAGHPFARTHRIEGLVPPGPGTVTPDETIRDRLRMLAAVDESLGTIMEALAQQGVLDRTVIILARHRGPCPSRSTSHPRSWTWPPRSRCRASTAGPWCRSWAPRALLRTGGVPS